MGGALGGVCGGAWGEGRGERGVWEGRGEGRGERGMGAVAHLVLDLGALALAGRKQPVGAQFKGLAARGVGVTKLVDGEELKVRGLVLVSEGEALRAEKGGEGQRGAEKVREGRGRGPEGGEGRRRADGAGEDGGRVEGGGFRACIGICYLYT